MIFRPDDGHESVDGRGAALTEMTRLHLGLIGTSRESKRRDVDGGHLGAGKRCELSAPIRGGMRQRVMIAMALSVNRSC